ncbi:MAG: superoxide dismutase family protein [Chloroflexota bacterium]|nr:superoxide dismutase family protein [Chloroflexota bacterium]
MKRITILVAILAALMSTTAAMADGEDATATASLINTQGAVIGTATFTQLNETLVKIEVTASGLTPGRHGVHIHSVGSCTPGTTTPFSSAGGHFNPTGGTHGLHGGDGAHAGDLHNLVVRPDGTVDFVLTTSRVSLLDGPTSLFDADGSALVIHADEDDQETNPTGNSGARVACGAIQR